MIHIQIHPKAFPWHIYPQQLSFLQLLSQTLQVHRTLTPPQAQNISPAPQGPIKGLPARGLSTPSTPPDPTSHPWHTTPVLNENTQERQSRASGPAPRSPWLWIPDRKWPSRPPACGDKERGIGPSHPVTRSIQRKQGKPAAVYRGRSFIRMMQRYHVLTQKVKLGSLGTHTNIMMHAGILCHKKMNKFCHCSPVCHSYGNFSNLKS